MSLNTLFSKLKGGTGSGNFGHAGRPGKHGGSAPGSGSIFGQLRNASDVIGTPSGGTRNAYIVSLPGDKKAIVKVARKGSYKEEEIHKEEVVYKLSKLYGLDVPETITRENKGNVESVQLWADKPTATSIDTGWGKEVNTEEFKNMSIFDSLVSNTDRTGSNFLVGKNGSVTLIDNGLSFVDASSVSNRINYSEKFYKVYGKGTGNINYKKSDFDKFLDPAKTKEAKQIINEKLGKEALDIFEDRLNQLQSFQNEMSE